MGVRGGRSLGGTAQRLNERHIEAPRGGSWHPSGVKRGCWSDWRPDALLFSEREQETGSYEATEEKTCRSVVDPEVVMVELIQPEFGDR